jgi:transcriptional regulator with XRE-family HTH domain
MDKIDSTIGKCIRHYRWLQGISQTDLANAVGISLAQLRSHEAGKSRVTAARLMAIASHLGVEVSAFFQRYPDGPGAMTTLVPIKARPTADAVQNGKYLAALMTHFQRLNETQKQAVLELVVSISKEGGKLAQFATPSNTAAAPHSDGPLILVASHGSSLDKRRQDGSD